MERQLISRELAESQGSRGVCRSATAAFRRTRAAPMMKSFGFQVWDVMRMWSDVSRVLRKWLAPVFVMVTRGGCASVFSAQVTRYQQWPDQTVGARYWIEPDEAQRNNLQFQTFADTIRADFFCPVGTSGCPGGTGKSPSSAHFNRYHFCVSSRASV